MVCEIRGSFWKWWEGKQKRASGGCGDERQPWRDDSDEKDDGHVLCAPLTQRPRSSVRITLDHPDLNSAPFTDCLRLANVVLLPLIVRFEMTCVSFYVIKFTEGKDA
jgi:hypothetical protein